MHHREAVLHLYFCLVMLILIVAYAATRRTFYTKATLMHKQYE